MSEIDHNTTTAHLDPDRVIADLRAVTVQGSSEHDVTKWPARRLIDHVVTRHHTYIRAQVPVISAYLAKLLARHGEHHPELARLAAIFAGVSEELALHMKHEEEVLFPAIEWLAERHGRAASRRLDDVLQQPIATLEDEHEWASQQLVLTRSLTHGYEVPAGGCATWTACYLALDDFEHDLHEHVHLENNVLFPLALRLSEPAVAG